MYAIEFLWRSRSEFADRPAVTAAEGSDVESVLVKYPSVRDAVVVGVADERWDGAVHAVIQLHAGHEADVPELLAMVRQEHRPLKTPKAIRTVTGYPYGAVGKVQKTDIVAEIVGRQVEEMA